MHPSSCLWLPRSGRIEKALRSCPFCPRRVRGGWALFAPIALAGVLVAGCGAKTPPPPPPCDPECQDAVVLRAVREMMKFAFNSTFQKEPVGFHDLTTTAFLRGSARVRGTAVADGEQGVTDVDLTYVFTQAVFPKKDSEPDDNYIIALDGTITQVGKIAIQPSSPTALKMKSVPALQDADSGEPDAADAGSVTVAGTVYDPPIEYPVTECALEILQNGNSVAGMFCGRRAGFSF